MDSFRKHGEKVISFMAFIMALRTLAGIAARFH
jgi:membrane protein DedA with SNARE-associated domain